MEGEQGEVDKGAQRRASDWMASVGGFDTALGGVDGWLLLVCSAQLRGSLPFSCRRRGGVCSLCCARVRRNVSEDLWKQRGSMG